MTEHFQQASFSERQPAAGTSQIPGRSQPYKSTAATIAGFSQSKLGKWRSIDNSKEAKLTAAVPAYMSMRALQEVRGV